jgi:hypothetical protein
MFTLTPSITEEASNADQINADLLAFVKDNGAHSSSRGAGILTTV